MKTVISSWIYIAPKGEISVHPQVGRDIGSQKIQNYYWRSIACLMGSAAEVCPDSRRIIFSNLAFESLPVIDGIDLGKLFKQLSVEYVVLGTLSLPPKGYFGAWGTQFIVIDCMERLAAMCREGDVILLLDSDCIVRLPLEQALSGAVKEHTILRYTLKDGLNEPANGLTCAQLGKLAAAYQPAIVRESISYAGGEILAATFEGLAEAARLARSAYTQSLERHAKGLPKFNEEAHLLSYVYEVMGIKDGTANGYIKRIWTDRGLPCNIDGSERNLAIWHLPGEKKHGFIRAFRMMTSGRLLFKDTETIEATLNLKPRWTSLLRMHLMGLARPLYHRLRKLRR